MTDEEADPTRGTVPPPAAVEVVGERSLVFGPPAADVEAAAATNWPAGAFVQADCPALAEKVPARQSSAIGAPISPTNVPGGALTHADWPGNGWKLPTAHGKASVAPATFTNPPGGDGAHTD